MVTDRVRYFGHTVAVRHRGQLGKLVNHSCGCETCGKDLSLGKEGPIEIASDAGGTAELAPQRFFPHGKRSAGNGGSVHGRVSLCV